MGEFSADESAHELTLDVAETGEMREMHSGGVVVLRCVFGLDGRACPGGLTVLDKARR